MGNIQTHPCWDHPTGEEAHWSQVTMMWGGSEAASSDPHSPDGEVHHFVTVKDVGSRPGDPVWPPLLFVGYSKSVPTFVESGLHTKLTKNTKDES